MHSNQQLAAPLEHTAPNYSVTVKSLILIFFFFFLHNYTVVARLAHKDIWRFVYIFSNICRNLTALGVRNALWSIESSPILEISLNAALLNTLCYPYNTPEHRRNAFLALYLISDLPSKYGKVSSVASEFGNVRLCSSYNK